MRRSQLATSKTECWTCWQTKHMLQSDNQGHNGPPRKTEGIADVSHNRKSSEVYYLGTARDAGLQGGLQATWDDRSIAGEVGQNERECNMATGTMRLRRRTDRHLVQGVVSRRRVRDVDKGCDGCIVN